MSRSVCGPSWSWHDTGWLSRPMGGAFGMSEKEAKMYTLKKKRRRNWLPLLRLFQFFLSGGGQSYGQVCSPSFSLSLIHLPPATMRLALFTIAMTMLLLEEVIADIQPQKNFDVQKVSRPGCPSHRLEIRTEDHRTTSNPSKMSLFIWSVTVSNTEIEEIKYRCWRRMFL